MRIIKKGQICQLKEKIKKCKKCDTVFAYTKEDYYWDMSLGKYVECLVCHLQLYTSIFDRKVKNNEKSR